MLPHIRRDAVLTGTVMRRGKQEYQAVMATPRKDPQKLNILRAGGKHKLSRHPFGNPIARSVRTLTQWDALVSSSSGISLFSLQPTQITKWPQGAGWGLAAPAHLARSSHYLLLPSRPCHTAGAEVQDHHGDNGGGAVGALLLPLRWLGDQLHPQGIGAAHMALRGTPSHPKSTESRSYISFHLAPSKKNTTRSFFVICVLHIRQIQTPQPPTASLRFLSSPWCQDIDVLKEIPQ